MRFFNEKWQEAIKTGKFICSVCGKTMFFEDDWEETLICSKCGHECDINRYGVEDDDEYEALYPTYEELTGEAENSTDDEDCEDDSGETYREVCGELEDN